jgi:hypothetical protein
VTFVLVSFYSIMHECITLDRECRLQNTLIDEAEVQELIFENSVGSDAIIYTDGSVIRHVRSSGYIHGGGWRNDSEGGMWCICTDHK